jgi:hypothetical protein
MAMVESLVTMCLAGVGLVYIISMIIFKKDGGNWDVHRAGFPECAGGGV